MRYCSIMPITFNEYSANEIIVNARDFGIFLHQRTTNVCVCVYMQSPSQLARIKYKSRLSLSFIFIASNCIRYTNRAFIIHLLIWDKYQNKTCLLISYSQSVSL